MEFHQSFLGIMACLVSHFGQNFCCFIPSFSKIDLNTIGKNSKTWAAKLLASGTQEAQNWALRLGGACCVCMAKVLPRIKTSNGKSLNGKSFAAKD
jgi:hypothetical protein